MKSIDFKTYYDKVYGGWIGKCVGGNIGAAVENNKYLMDLNENEIFPEEIPPNDDLDLQLLWLQVLEEKGIHIKSRDLAEAWETYCWYPFNEYGYFLHNFERKIYPPVSGAFNNEYFRQSMGSPIRSEIWGMISIGNASLAMEYAEKDATLDHDTESVWAEQMLAAIEAEAFFENDLNRLIEFGLNNIPQESGLYKCIRFVQQKYLEGATWTEARQMLLEQFGHPDASKAVQNLGITMLALIYGELDFGKTQLISLNCGYDTDCTCATAGAILGIMAGASGLPEDWKMQARDTFTVGIDVKRPSPYISDLAMDTCRVGVAISQSINSEVVIEDVPESLNADKISTIKNTNPVEFGINYLNGPAVGVGEKVSIQLTITNRTDQLIEGRLFLAASDICQISHRDAQMTLLPGDPVTQKIDVIIPPDSKRIPSSYVVNVSFKVGEQEIAKDSFGLAGSTPYYIIGPFWDLYDTKQHDKCPFYDPVTNRKARPIGAANFNNYINVDKSYISEENFENLPNGRIFNAPEDKLPLNEWFKMSGPACVYLVQDIESPEERDARIMLGNNDSFKLWVNDKLVAQQKDHWFWMPYNHDVKIKLKKGRNRIVLKAVRTDKEFEFSLGFAKPNTHVRWMNDLVKLVIEK